jgi:hypothetical protein
MTCTIQDVIKDEMKDVVQRRKVAFPQGTEKGESWTEANVAGDLVGLAFSGGGIRSAMFNLGLLQALHKVGLLRYVDYLSTVSGGSYIGAHYSSQLLRMDEARKTVGPCLPPPVAEQKERFPLTQKHHGDQPSCVLRFIRSGGQYLDRPWDLAAKYLSGLALNLIVFTSGLVFVCASVAWLWRLFDEHWLRDTVMTFGEEDKGGWRHWWTSDLVRGFLPALLLACAYFLMRLVLKRATQRAMQARGDERLDRGRRTHWLRRVTRALGWCAWLSVLVSAVVVLGNGDTSIGPLSKIVPERWLTYNPVYGDRSNVDFEFLPNYLKVSKNVLLIGTGSVVVLLCLLSVLFPKSLLVSGQQPRSLLDRRLFRTTMAALLLGFPLVTVYYLAKENVSGKASQGKLIRVKFFPDPWPEGATKLEVTGVRLISEDDLFFVKDQDRGHLGSAPKITMIELSFKRPIPEELRYNKRGVRYALLSPWEDAPSDTRSQATKLQEVGPTDIPNVVFLTADGDPGLPDELDKFWIDVTIYQKDALGVPENGLSCVSIGLGVANRPNVARLGKDRDDNAPAATSGDAGSGQTLVDYDQAVRRKFAIISGLIFLVSGTLISFNWTSLHSFYRDRLAETYLEPTPLHGRDVPLSELDNTSLGGPYHLISGTLNLLGYRKSIERTWSFLFSRRYCGSTVTEYQETRACLGTRFNDLATVTAISGAAVSPAQGGSLGAAFLMTLSNVRLGQWLPHPARGATWFGWPSAISLLLDALRDAEDRKRCFVTDGGHSENLGLWPLIQRRCKLIFVSDAGQDSEHSLNDFLKLCRRIRLHHGVQFLNLNSGPVELGAITLCKDKTCRYHFFVGRIRYPNTFMRDSETKTDEGQQSRPLEEPPIDSETKTDEGCEEGYLVYLKPSMTNDEDNDLLGHFKTFKPFPHDPTLDQFFDEDKVESYRQLGFHIGEILGRNLEPPELDLWDPARRLDVVEELFKKGLVRGSHADQLPLAEPNELAAVERLVGLTLNGYESSENYRVTVANRVQELIRKVSNGA